MCSQTVLKTHPTSPLGFATTEQWLEAIPVGIIIINTEGAIIYGNSLAFDFFKCHPKNEKWHDVLLSNVKGTSDNGHYIYTHSGRYLVIKTQALPQNQGQLILLIDGSDIKENNESTLKWEKIGSIAKLSATLAHQLRTPLSTAYLYASNLSVESLSTNDLKLYQEKIVEQLDNIKQQMDSVLLTHKGAQALCEAVNIVELIQELRDNFAELYPHVIIKLECVPSIRVFVCAHQTALRGALNNIVENAIQASENSKIIDIRVQLINNNVLMEVTDYGTGISQAHLHKIMTGFFTTKKEGNGLGLMIAKSIIEAHQGKLSIDSKLGQYTTISITLPKLKD